MVSPVWEGRLLPAAALVWTMRSSWQTGVREMKLALLAGCAHPAAGKLQAVELQPALPVGLASVAAALRPTAYGVIFSLVVSVICPLALVVGGQHLFRATPHSASQCQPASA